MKLVLKCNSTNENYDGGCSYALVHLTPELAQLALRRIAQREQMKQLDPDIWDVYYWNYGAQYFGIEPTETPSEFPEDIEELLADLDLGEADEIKVPDNFQIPEGFRARTECDQMMVSDTGIAFFCYPKHCDPHITTSYIMVETLKEAAQVAEVKAL